VNGALIRIEDVSKVYYRDTIQIPVLANIDLTIGRGEFLALMGPSAPARAPSST